MGIPAPRLPSPTTFASTILPSTKNSPRSDIGLNGNMAATPDQLALTKANRAPTISTSTRQAVPAFLNKLYNMVNNPDTDELVRWSDEGDSFYIPSHERLSKELLPRFFKHGNFSSFVRQLNMYGFHKVPHLQQGVLQNSTETELWQFQNPHFQRGQPDLLCLITRKKTGANTDNTLDEAQHNNAAAGPIPNANQAAGPLDMTILNSSMTAIKKHQTSLSAELKTLQESNQHLWNEALAARDRHKKHQDTINKILKFLASVFGNGATGATPSASAGGSSTSRDGRASPGALVPRKRPRLMIENGSADDDEDFVHFATHESPDLSMLNDDQDEEMAEGRISEAPPDVMPAPVTRPEHPTANAKSEPPPTPALESVAQTPASIPNTNSPPTATNSLQTAPVVAGPTTSPASPMNSVVRRSSSQNNTPTSAQASISPITPTNPPPPTPASAFPPTDEHAQEQMYQEAIAKLLSSPNALQKILAMVSNQGPEHPPAHPETHSELAPYYGGLMNMSLDTAPDPSLAYGAARLDQSTETLSQDVANTDQDINNLMREWGITPDMLQDHPVDPQLPSGYINPAGFDQSHTFAPNGDFTHMGGIGAPSQSTGFASIAPEGEQVDIDTFFNQFEFPDEPDTSSSANHSGQPTTQGISEGSAFPVPLAAEFDLANPGPHSASFLDEVHTIPSGTSDTSLSPAIPLLDDFSQAAPVAPVAAVAPTSPKTVRLPAQSKTTPVVTAVPITNGTIAPAAIPTTKRGRKRRSTAGEVPTVAVEELSAPTRTTRK
ncbi:stress-responsive transcription factor hsf1 [Ceratobasidium sp. 428]|nr:stress-responsive transcription factor hsf1 [Ceratobasidium sp. 428]